jgi:ribonuclease HI
VVDAVTKGWLKGWLQKGFKGKKNEDLWRRFVELARHHTLYFQWVKGHAGHAENERCDQLAVAAASRPNLPPDLAYEQNQED